MEKRFMEQAIELAKKAGEAGEVPVAALIVKDGQVIATGENTRERDHCALGHAEINAIAAACKKTGGWRLDGCTLYVTLEPCPMCAGAIINARISTVVFGAYDPAAGSFESVEDFCRLSYGFKPEVYGGICEEACKELLTGFFGRLRHET